MLEKLNLQTLHIRRRHYDDLFLISVFSGTKYCPLFSKQSAAMFLPGTYATLPGSFAPTVTALHLEVFLLQIRFVNMQIFLITHGSV
jgi:hypothetical protein